MSTLPERFNLVVGIDKFGKAFIVDQVPGSMEAQTTARQKASENIGSVFAVMKIEEAYQAGAPIPHAVFLPWPTAPASDAEAA